MEEINHAKVRGCPASAAAPFFLPSLPLFASSSPDVLSSDPVAKSHSGLRDELVFWQEVDQKTSHRNRVKHLLLEGEA